MPIFHARRPLVLASASPRRIAFFAELGLTPTVLVPPSQAEPSPVRGEKPESYALRAALAKAAGAAGLPEYAAIRAASPHAHPVIIAADTIVVLGRRILGKPRDAGHALDMLRALAGKKHRVITGCALLDNGASRSFAVQSRVLMWDCPDDLLRAYVSGGEPMDKAGAYAVQGVGACLVQRIAGSWSNVVGLPLAELVQTLLEMDAIAPDGKR